MLILKRPGLLVTILIANYISIFANVSFAQWINVTPDSNLRYNQILFVDSLRGYVAADLGASYPDTSGVILITTDGGKAWTSRRLSQGGLLSISAIGDSFIWASSGFGEVCRSNDGGKTWRNSIVGYSLLTIQFVDTLDGWLVWTAPLGLDLGSISGIFRTINGGLTWKLQHGDTSRYPTYQGRGCFLDSLHGWVAQYVGVRRTIDGGETWSPIIYVGGPENMQATFFLDTLRGWAVGWHGIGKTTDGGVGWSGVWNIFPGPSVPQFNSVFFVDTSDG